MQAAAWIHSTTFVVVFSLVAFVFSIFHGAMAADIFVSADARKGKSWAWHVHQFWLNFCGSVAGWAALWFIIQKVAALVASRATAAPQWSDAALFFLAFLGVTGYLPFAIMTSVQAIKELISKIPGLGK